MTAIIDYERLAKAKLAIESRNGIVHTTKVDGNQWLHVVKQPEPLSPNSYVRLSGRHDQITIGLLSTPDYCFADILNVDEAERFLKQLEFAIMVAKEANT